MPKKLGKAHEAVAPSHTVDSKTTNAPDPSAALDPALPLPSMVVFDLDYTLWPLWVDTNVSPPLRAAGPDRATDRTGASYALYADVPGVLTALRQVGIRVGAASRTHAPDLARDLLKILCISSEHGGEQGSEKPLRAWDVFDAGLEIYPGSKLRHMEALARRTGIPYSEILFFDDERRNRDVEDLGVTMCLVADGVTWGELERGIQMWRKRREFA